MPTAHLTVGLPENVWVGRVSRKYPEVRIRVLAAVAEKREGVVMAELQAPNPDDILSDIRASDDVSDVVVLERADEEVLAQIETASAILLDHAQQSGVPIEMPFTVKDGQTVWELTASRERLSELGELFTADGIPFTVNSINHDVERQDILTEPQWEVLMAAIDEGYYDTPRCCTQTELAEKLDLAKSTCSETLHRAEERIIKQFVEEHPDSADYSSTDGFPVTESRTTSVNKAD